MNIAQLRKVMNREIALMDAAWHTYCAFPTAKNFTEFNIQAGRVSLAEELHDEAMERSDFRRKKQVYWLTPKGRDATRGQSED